MRSPVGFVAWFMILVGTAGPCAAQVMYIYPSESPQCLANGFPVPEREVVEARKPAIKKMEAYWRRASIAPRLAGAAKDSLTARWLSGSLSLSDKDLANAVDPLAQDSSLVLEPNPLSFQRGMYNGTSVAGIWRIYPRGDPGRTIAYYRVEFWRALWGTQISKISVIDGMGETPVVTPFCSYVGDVDNYPREHGS